jgi:hypothetical protein
VWELLMVAKTRHRIPKVRKSVHALFLSAHVL